MAYEDTRVGKHWHRKLARTGAFQPARHLAAGYAAFRVTLKWLVVPSNILDSVTNVIARIILLAWVGTSTRNAEALVFIAIGFSFLAMWNRGLGVMSFSLADEFYEGTLDHLMVSKTPITVVIFGKALAAVLSTIPTGVVTFVVVLLLCRVPFAVERAPLLLLSVVLVLLATAAVGLLFAPITIMLPAYDLFIQNAAWPAAMILSGFLYPVHLLPAVVRVAAGMLPSSWAMDAVFASQTAGASVWRIGGDWLMSVLLSATLLVITHLLLRAAEKRIRVTGTLTAY